MTSNVNLHAEHFCIFLSKWLTDRTQSNIKSYVYKYMFEVITTKLSCQANTCFHQGVATTCGIKLYENKLPSFKQDLLEGPQFVRAGFFFLGQAVTMLHCDSNWAVTV